MTPIAPHITNFLREHLPRTKGLSQNTTDTYAYAFKLLFAFAAAHTRIKPSQLCVEHLDSGLIIDFLNDIEAARGNGVRTRNLRLAAIKAFMRYLELKLPVVLAQVRQVLAIPTKRHDHPLVQHLVMDEIRAILDAPDLSTRLGIRDRAMMHLCFAGGLRVSELVGLPLADVQLQRSPRIQVLGKGRKQRCLPLWKETTTDLRAWLAVRGDVRAPELFVNAEGTAMTRAGFEYILDKHVAAAVKCCSTLQGRSITPHQLRHSCAVLMLQATRDIRKVALWLGHSQVRTTEIYLRVDPTEKLEAIEAILPPGLRRGKFRPPDALIASLMERA
jgi:integrase/recombinase XerD